MQMETSTTVSGKMIRPTGSVFTVISMGPATRATGKRTSNMVRGLRHGLMEPAIRVTM